MCKKDAPAKRGLLGLEQRQRVICGSDLTGLYEPLFAAAGTPSAC